MDEHIRVAKENSGTGINGNRKTGRHGAGAAPQQKDQTDTDKAGPDSPKVRLHGQSGQSGDTEARSPRRIYLKADGPGDSPDSGNWNKIWNSGSERGFRSDRNGGSGRKKKKRNKTAGYNLQYAGRRRKQAKRKNRAAKSAGSKDAFYESWEWCTARYKALRLHGAKCQCCGRTRQDGAKICVDHIKPRALCPELALEVSNLQILCDECNRGKGRWDETDWRD